MSSQIGSDVEAWFAAARARGGVGTFGLAAIVGDSRDILARWDEIAGTPAADEVRRLLLDHVPATLRTYYEIPVEVLPSDRLLTLSTLGGGAEGTTLVLMARRL